MAKKAVDKSRQAAKKSTGKKRTAAKKRRAQQRAAAKPLSERALKFAHEYAAHGLNGTAAAIAAGYAERTANRQASRLLDDPRVLKLIAEVVAVPLADAEVTTERVLQELAAIAFVDPADIWEDGGTIRNISDIPTQARRAIAGISRRDTKEGISIALKMHSKPAALETLGKYLRMFGTQLPEVPPGSHVDFRMVVHKGD